MASNNYIYKMSNAGGMSTVTRYTDMLAGNTTWSPWEPAGAYESIASVTVGSSGASSITFSGIPSTYTHLQVRASSKSSGTNDGTWLRFNSDATSGNYANHDIYGDGASVGAEAFTTSQTGIIDSVSLLGSSYTNIYGASIVDILDYTNTSKNKTVRTFIGADVNGGGGVILLRSGVWLSTSAITSITIVPRTTGAFAQYSSVSLYGIRGN